MNNTEITSNSGIKKPKLGPGILAFLLFGYSFIGWWWLSLPVVGYARNPSLFSIISFLILSLAASTIIFLAYQSLLLDKYLLRSFLSPLAVGLLHLILVFTSGVINSPHLGLGGFVIFVFPIISVELLYIVMGATYSIEHWTTKIGKLVGIFVFIFFLIQFYPFIFHFIFQLLPLRFTE